MLDVLKDFFSLIYMVVEIACNIIYLVYVAMKYIAIGIYRAIKLCIKLVKRIRLYYKKRKNDKIKTKLMNENNKNYIEEGNFSIIQKNGKYILKIGEE